MAEQQRFIRLATEEEAAPWHPVPAGFRVEVVEEGPEWRTVLDAALKSCYFDLRRPCTGRPVAALRRAQRGTRHGRWWFYCAEHMYVYGRWIEDGRVVGCRLARVEPDGTPNRQEE